MAMGHRLSPDPVGNQTLLPEDLDAEVLREIDEPVGGTSPAALAMVTADSVAYFVYWLVILVLLSLALTSALGQWSVPVGTQVASSLICMVWMAFCLTLGVLRGRRPDGRDAPPPTWLPVATTAGCLTSLVLLRSSGPTVATSTAELVVAGLLVASMAVWRGIGAGLLLGTVLSALLLTAPLADPDHASLLRTPLATTVAGVVIMGAGLAAALAMEWLERGAQQLQASLDRRDEVLVRERAVGAAASVEAEVERALHDTALNTLETVAAHGAVLDPAVVVARCRSDVEQLSQWRFQSGYVGIGEVLSRLEEHAENLQLEVAIRTVDVDPNPVEIPPAVLQALAGAAREALTNVGKHSGSRSAAILVMHDREEAHLLIVDEGIGMTTAETGGFGLVRSVAERMDHVGGSGTVAPGPNGVGTVVDLAWRPAPEGPARVAADLLLNTAFVVSVLCGVVAGVTSLLTVLGWPAFGHPWPALVASVVPALIAAWLLLEVRAGTRINVGHVLAVSASYIGAGATAILADPYCSSLVGEGGAIDSRALMVATLLILAPRIWVLVASLLTVLVAHIGGALLWHLQWPGCGENTLGSALFVSAGLVAAWMFARRMDRLATAYSVIRRQEREAEVRIRSQLMLRAEEELWVADTLASAQEMLSRLADGELPPSHPMTRALCGAEAGFLRGLLVVGRGSDELRRPARIWLRILRTAGCIIEVRGSFAECFPPPSVVGSVGGVLDTLAGGAPRSRVTISAWNTPPDGMSLTVTATGTAIERGGTQLAERVKWVSGAAWTDIEPETITLEWTWLQERG